MASFGKHFAVNQKDGKSHEDAIKQGSFYRFTVLTDRLIRLEYSKDGSFNDEITDFAKNRNFEVPKFKCEEDDHYLIITTKYFSLQYAKEKPFKGPSFAPDTNLRVKLLNTDKIWYYDHPEARNFLGTAFSLDDFKGTVKLSKGLYSTDGFVSISDNNPYVLNELGIMIKPETNNLDIYLFMYRRDFGLCLKDYFNLTGYPTMLPRYALGLWWYRDKIYNFDAIKRLTSNFENNEIPLNVLLLGEFWHIKDSDNVNIYKSGYTFNKNLFPEPEKLVKYLHEKNIRLGLNIDHTEGVRKEEPTYELFYNEMEYKPENNIPFNAFDKMFIIVYFESIIEPLTKMDVDFFWLDYKKEANSLRALSYYHIRDFYKSDDKRPMLLTRNPGVAAHNKGVLYSGETIVSWNTLRYLPFYNASASNIGVSWWSHDIGGFKDGIEDAELYMRYAQFGTYSPIFRLSAKRGIYYKREPWVWDFKTFNIVKEYINLRQKLIPYLYTENYNYAINGVPLVQPLYYNYPQMFDEENYKNEYYFGSEFFVSPITNPKDKVMNRVIQRLFLPKGTWYDFKTGKKFAGGKKYVAFYKDEDYPVFVKAGAIIPMADTSENYNLISNPEKMELHIFPGVSNTYKLYEDDGISNMYERGLYHITAIDYNYMQNNYSVIIHSIEGKNSVIPEKRDYKVYFRNTKMADKVDVFFDGTKIEDGIETEVTETDFIVFIKDAPTNKQLTINCGGKDIEIDTGRIVNDDINSIINDLKIKTNLKDSIARIVFSNLSIKKKRIAIKKLSKNGLEANFIKMFMKLYDYLAEIQND